ncbi:ceramidase [Desarmillaria tabescens]|uniref:Ceramidase n=1 Tax=Armillaria tabescens TaxID=1929756 RepID=A0AA39NIH9_ARMTA|nr:ceramidase [Desarmillaria tabescens]KAK0466263.1 ceramidase [Desarmillaria tabescens]
MQANYRFSHYIAEFANTLSTTIFLILAAYGTFRARRESLPTRYVLSYAFHATLLFHFQLADELPMIYLVSISCWFLYDRIPGYRISSAANPLLPLNRVCILIFHPAVDSITDILASIANRNPIYFQWVFAILCIAKVALITHLLMWSKEHLAISEDAKYSIASIFSIGAVLFVIGFVIWNIDGLCCDYLTDWKSPVGHAWWHLFSGFGVYFMFVGTHCDSLCVKDHHKNYAVEYRYGIPFIGHVHKEE